MKGEKPVRSQPLKVLFILHQASLTGAPIILVELAGVLFRDYGITGTFLVMEDGPLIARCRQLADTRLWTVANRNRQFGKLGKMGKLVERFYYSFRHRRIIAALRNTDVVVSNTIANGAILERLSLLSCPVISYVHELPYTVKSVTTSDTLEKVLRFSHYFLAGSAAVRNYLVRELKVDAERTAVLHSSIDVQAVLGGPLDAMGNRFRMDHMISADTMIVGVASTAEWRKGFDLWFPLVRLFRGKFPGRKVVFVWKGYRGNIDGLYTDLFDFRKTGLAEQVILLPHDGESRKTISAFDIHLLLSREDPYPLVVLEAACFGIPTICFDQAGGAPEFVEDDAGVCVPYGDLNGVADALEKMMQLPEFRESLGNRARSKVLERHTVDLAAAKLWEIVNSVSVGKGIPRNGEQLAGIFRNKFTKELS